MSVISVYLSPLQMKKAISDKTFQVSKNDIDKEPNAKMELSRVLANRYEKAKGNKKGFRFPASQYKLIEGEGCECGEGGKLTFKKILKALKPYAKLAGKKVVNVGADWLDGNTPLTDKQIAGLKTSANQAIDGDSKGALKTLKKTGDEAIKDQIDKIDANVNEAEATDGKGLKRKSKFVKGSAEAKAFMASLREKRKAKSGTGLVNDIQKGLKNQIKKEVNNAKELGKELVRKGLKHGKNRALDAVQMGLTGALAVASTEAGLTPVAGLAAAEYLNKKIDKKWRGKGLEPVSNQPTGHGRFTLLQQIKPEIFVNKGNMGSSTGGSFLVPKSNGGSFKVAGKGGGALPANGSGFLPH